MLGVEVDIFFPAKAKSLCSRLVLPIALSILLNWDPLSLKGKGN
jgi:hypothetical protein